MNIFFLAPFLALLCLCSAAAGAQPAAAPATASSPAAPLAGYQSVFQDYTAYTDEKTVDWKTANDTTARIGGWRAYAKEASAPAATPGVTPALPTAPLAADKFVTP